MHCILFFGDFFATLLTKKAQFFLHLWFWIGFQCLVEINDSRFAYERLLWESSGLYQSCRINLTRFPSIRKGVVLLNFQRNRSIAKKILKRAVHKCFHLKTFTYDLDYLKLTIIVHCEYKNTWIVALNAHLIHRLVYY